MADFVEILSPKALSDLKEANAEVLTLISNMDKVGFKMKGASTPSGANNANKELTAHYVKLEKDIEKVRLAEIRLQQSREKAFDKYEAQLTREQAKLAAAQNLYSKVEVKLRSLSNEYKELATAKALGAKQTDEEAKRMEFLLGKITKYDTALKAVDATMGKHSRNVGNYTNSGFNPLANSINQLTREMPAFTYSVQTGFMALSNNIPIFTDAIGNAIAQNKLLQAEGKPTTSVLKQLAGAFLSWQTLMGVGITLLTVYGKEIGDFISKSFESAKATNAMTLARKELNDASVKGQKAAVEETVNLKSLLAIAKDTSLSYRERVIAVNELQDTYPAYFGNLTKEQILAGQTAEAERELTGAILARAKANAAVEKITENQGKLIDIELRKLEITKEQAQAEKDLQREKIASQGSSGGQLVTGVNQNQFNASVRLASLRKELNSLLKDESDLTVINNALTNFAIKNEKESILLKEKKSKIDKEANREKLVAVELENKNTDVKNALISKIEEEIATNKRYRDEAATNIDQYRQFDKVVRDLSEALDLIKNPSKYMSKDVSGLEAQQKAVEKHKKGLKDLQKAMEAYSNSFYTNFVSNSGFETTFKILNDEIIGFGSNAKVTALAISESFQEAFNFISQFGQANFDAQRERLRQDKEIAIAFAGESQTAIDEINRQAEEKEKQIRIREFKAKKQQAIFNIAIDTAQAIAATIGRTGFFGIPLTAIVAAIGAAQIAMVQAQPVPAYKTGTDNHKGGLMLVNDGSGSNYKETIVTPDGKIYQPQERNVFMDKPKGTKVFTHDQWQRNLDNILTSNSINYAQPNVVVNSGGMSDAQVDRIVSTINNKSEAHLNIDKNGFNVKIRNGHTQKEILNNQVTFGR